MVNGPTDDPVTMVLHELRAPLGLMATAARCAAEECTDDFLRGRCEAIVGAAERLLRTAHTVFALTQAASFVQRSTFAPAASVRGIVGDLQGLGLSARLAVEGAADEFAFEASQDQFETLVTSLLSNAQDHAEPGTSLDICIGPRADGLAIEISNTLAKRSRHSGLGLGSHIADQLAVLLPVTLHRRTDAGRFSVEIVLASPQRGAMPQTARPRPRRLTNEGHSRIPAQS